MAEGKNPLSVGGKVLIAIIALIVLFGGVYAIVKLVIPIIPDNITAIGSTATQTAINAPDAVEKVVGVTLGEKASTNWETLILYLVIFMILFFAFSDIVSLFSTFNDVTSWVIGFGLAVIAGVTNVIQFIAGVFSITAGIGAVGIALIIISGVFAVVILNLGIRGPLKKWQRARQKDIDSFKAERGFAKVVDFVKGSKTVSEGAAEGEKGK